MADRHPVCGVIMPISSIDGCSGSHWSDVLEILTEAIEEAGFSANLVSNADDVGLIHKRIIQNLYDNPIVVCDVSGKNANVMFELGMRLAFDKPTIIVKDDKTSYSFDTSAIEHIEYPRDLRFSKIIEFKQKLSEKIKATHDRASSDKNYTTFLGHFGEFTVAKLKEKEVSGQEYILEELREVRRSVNLLMKQKKALFPARRSRDGINICMKGKSDDELNKAAEYLSKVPGVIDISIEVREEGRNHLRARISPGSNINTSELRYRVLAL